MIYEGLVSNFYLQYRKHLLSKLQKLVTKTHFVYIFDKMLKERLFYCNVLLDP